MELDQPVRVVGGCACRDVGNRQFCSGRGANCSRSLRASADKSIRRLFEFGINENVKYRYNE
jgi:hypothetical protein